MIKLKQLNGSEIVVNADLIKFIQRGADTVITTVDGDILAVDASVDKIISLIIEYKQKVLGVRIQEPLV